jgi:hypothetical protein
MRRKILPAMTQHRQILELPGLRCVSELFLFRPLATSEGMKLLLCHLLFFCSLLLLEVPLKSMLSHVRWSGPKPKPERNTLRF